MIATGSLRWRLLAGATAAILLALLLAWGFMTLLFQRHLERQQHDEMQRDALALLSALTLAADGAPQLRDAVADPRMQAPAGGYYWQVATTAGRVRSRSLWDEVLSAAPTPDGDGWASRQVRGPFGQSVVVLSRRIREEGVGTAIDVQIAQDVAPVRAARNDFALELALFLAVLWLVLTGAAWVQVSLGLAPLRRLGDALAALRDNARARLPDTGLREVQPLADAINALADARGTDLERARRRAADLAHGLKTPLAALSAQSRRAREDGAPEAAEGIDRAIAAIATTLETEFARTRLANADPRVDDGVALATCVEQLVDVLEHTERGGQLAFAIDVDDALRVAVPAAHLSELLGAVLENAVRYARRVVRVHATVDVAGLYVVVEDDGPGIAGDRQREALARGRRLDESAGGTGLGLAIAREAAEASGGTIRLGESALGGLAVAFRWPPGVARPGHPLPA